MNKIQPIEFSITKPSSISKASGGYKCKKKKINLVCGGGRAEMAQEPKPHILILPFPAQGHIKPMLYLAQLLSDAGLHVTFLNTDHNHRRVISDLPSLSSRFPSLHFESISDGLPQDNSSDLPGIAKLLSSLRKVTKPSFRDFLKRQPVSCVIADGIMSFVAMDAAEELGIRVITFRTHSAYSFWVYCCLPNLIEGGEIPFTGDDDMDRETTRVPGMEGLLRRKDLPSICKEEHYLKFFVDETIAMTRASSLILNTFDDLEAPILSHIATKFPKIYTLGPIHSLFKSRIGFSANSSSSSITGLWNADTSCMAWLDSQPKGSVVYVSFGSLVMMTHDQLLELWHGLVNSGKNFLWVIRSNMLLEGEAATLSGEMAVGTRDRGLILNWVPQEEVLGHPAVGAFLTHGGWNSILEGIGAGLPLICWPQFADQTLNSRWVDQVWRIGSDNKDTWDRSTVEKMVRTVMEDQGEEMRKCAGRYADLARDAISAGGLSSKNLEKLIEDLKKQAVN